MLVRARVLTILWGGSPPQSQVMPLRGEDSLPVRAAPSSLTSYPSRSQARPIERLHLVRHGPLALRLLLRLGSLKRLLDEHSFWASGRTTVQLAAMLRGSEAVVSAWQEGELVGFGRATSDGIFRAVLWDVVVAGPQQGQGLGRRLVEELLRTPRVASAQRVYLMTTNGAAFYRRLGFSHGHGQQLLMLQRARDCPEDARQDGE
jgi:ribosomal protein S18 acetylase RimI-like enzyme